MVLHISFNKRFSFYIVYLIFFLCVTPILCLYMVLSSVLLIGFFFFLNTWLRFYEWKKDGSRKQPYYIHFKDGRPLVFAALYDTWQNSEGKNFYRKMLILHDTLVNVDVDILNCR